MRRLSAFAFLIAAAFATPVAGADDAAVPDAALTAFNAGDYAAAEAGLLPRAATGDADAQFFVGIMRLAGLGAPADPAAARSWLQRAAAQGHAPAQFRLAGLLRQGIGGEVDGAESVRWLRAAAEGGWFAAQMALAQRYALEDGVPHDPVEALKWYDVAAEMGLDPYNGTRDALAATMDTAAIAEAGRRTRAWLAAHRRWDEQAIAATAAMSTE